jgi:hypothetical protein
MANITKLDTETTYLKLITELMCSSIIFYDLHLVRTFKICGTENGGGWTENKIVNVRLYLMFSRVRVTIF